MNIVQQYTSLTEKVCAYWTLRAYFCQNVSKYINDPGFSKLKMFQNISRD